jgi:TusA-related sulfurtransferase
VADADMANELANWLDKLAIQELIYTYSDAASRGDWDVFATLFTADAVWEVAAPVDSRVVGAEEIVRTARTNVDAEDFLVQMTHGAVITLHGDDRASSTTTIHAIAKRQGHHDVTNYGIYYDELVKIDGAWKFSQRRLVPVYSDTTPHAGDNPISRAELAELQ